MELIFVFIYIAGLLYTARLVARGLAWDGCSYGSEPEGIDWIMGMMFGIFAGFLWPIALPVALLIQNPKVLSRIIGHPKRIEQHIKKSELEKKNRRIKELERELGIGQ